MKTNVLFQAIKNVYQRQMNLGLEQCFLLIYLPEKTVPQIEGKKQALVTKMSLVT